MGWRPIETAPKDGSKVLLFTVWANDDPEYPDIEPFDEAQTGWWDSGNLTNDYWHREPCWVTEKIGLPTHWMPLPEAPADRAETETWAVTQADRDAAASHIAVHVGAPQAEATRNGFSFTELAATFARHRHETQADLIEALREAEKEIAWLLGHMPTGSYSASGTLRTIRALLAKIGPNHET